MFQALNIKIVTRGRYWYLISCLTKWKQKHFSGHSYSMYFVASAVACDRQTWQVFEFIVAQSLSMSRQVFWIPDHFFSQPRTPHQMDNDGILSRVNWQASVWMRAGRSPVRGQTDILGAAAGEAFMTRMFQRDDAPVPQRIGLKFRLYHSSPCCDTLSYLQKSIWMQVVHTLFFFLCFLFFILIFYFDAHVTVLFLFIYFVFLF